jgi:hypothetical protein
VDVSHQVCSRRPSRRHCLIVSAAEPVQLFVLSVLAPAGILLWLAAAIIDAL